MDRHLLLVGTIGKETIAPGAADLHSIIDVLAEALGWNPSPSLYTESA